MLSRSRAFSWTVIGLVCWVPLSQPADVLAQVPSLTGTQPQAVAPGTATNLKVRGGNLTGASQLWTSFGIDSVLAPDIADNGKNAAESTWRVTVPSTVPIGIYGVRVAAPGGVSAMKLLLVDDLPSVAGNGANLSLDKAQEVALPVAVDGAIGGQQMQYFKFKAEAGQQVSFEVVARRMGSTLDPMIRVLNAKGRELAYSDDVAGLRSDSQLTYVFKDAGEYAVEVRDIQYRGGGDYIYRLRMGDFPCLSVPYPLGVQRGQTAKISFAGPSAADVPPQDVAVPADHAVGWTTVSGKRPNGKSSGFTLLRVSDKPEALEVEPNDELAKATRVELGHGLNGRVEKAGDVDFFVFAAKKGQAITFTGITQRPGAPTAIYLRVLNKTGGQIAAKEDFGIGDVSLPATFPEDGDYYVAVEELHRRGGSAFAYRIEAKPTEAGFDLAAAANTINIGALSTANITVTATRANYAGPIQIAATGLPEGVTSLPTVMGPGINTVVLTIRSTAEVASSKAIPVKIVGTAKIGDRDLQVVAGTEGALKTAAGNLAWAPQNLDEQVSLAVGKKPSVRFRAEPAEIVFGQSLQANVKLIVDREAGFDEVINFAVTPEVAKGGLPANITVEVKPIAKATNEIEVTFKATDKAALGDFTAVLIGTIKQGNNTVAETVPGITLKLTAPLTVTAAPAADKFAAGASVAVKVTIARNPALKGDAVLTFSNLPKGVTAAAATIPADKSEAEVVLTAAADAAKGAVANIQVKAEVTVGAAKFAGTSANVAITVE